MEKKFTKTISEEVTDTKTTGLAQEVYDLIEREALRVVDFKFVDLHGMWHHFSIPVAELTQNIFEEGIGFDGSSIRGFQQINESDMLLVPDATTAISDPFSSSTASIIANVKDPITGKMYDKDPRYVAQKAENYLKETGIGDLSYWGPELEFFVFDSIRYDQTHYHGYYYLDSNEGIWNAGKEQEGGNLGHRPKHKTGYFPVSPIDSQQELRNEMIWTMEKCGIYIERHHHEVATAGQNEIDMRYDSLVRMADKTMLYKYVVKNIALKHGKTATFMPKPLYKDNGSGMHVHQSIWKNGEATFFDENGYAGLSQTALHYIGGLLKHASALCAFIAPTTNSYKRLVPGYEAPVNLVYSKRNRSAAIRIPTYSNAPVAKRLEFRTPDPMANSYLAFSAMLMAGIDGIKHRIDPGEPLDENTYELSKERAKTIKSVPGSLEEAINALEEDHKFLLEGNVFTKELIDTWISFKRDEIDEIRTRPHPWEFFLYYDA